MRTNNSIRSKKKPDSGTSNILILVVVLAGLVLMAIPIFGIEYTSSRYTNFTNPATISLIVMGLIGLVTTTVGTVLYFVKKKK